MDQEHQATNLGARIRTLRRARGFTQDRLARSTGVSRSAVAQWESNRAGYSAGMLRRLANVLGVSINMLHEGWEDSAAAAMLTAHELALVRLYRSCAEEDRTLLMLVASKIATPAIS